MSRLPVEQFALAVRRQLLLNQARTPTERMQALFELRDAARAMAPDDADARERRRLVLARRAREKEQTRAAIRRLASANQSNPATGV